MVARYNVASAIEQANSYGGIGTLDNSAVLESVMCAILVANWNVYCAHSDVFKDGVRHPGPYKPVTGERD